MSVNFSVVIKNALAPSQTSWVSCCIRGSILFLWKSLISQFYLICCGCCRRVGSNTGRFKSMYLRKGSETYNLRCSLRPRNKTILSWNFMVFRCCVLDGNFYHFKWSILNFLGEHLELQKPFTGFVKPASVLIDETLLRVILQFSAEKFSLLSLLILSRRPRLFDINFGSVETLQTCSKK